MPSPFDAADSIHSAELLDAADRIAFYLIGFDEFAFADDLRTIDAVCLNLIRIGEASKLLSPRAKAELPTVPWPDFIALRNRVAHGYATLRVDLLWSIATIDVPTIAARLRSASD